MIGYYQSNLSKDMRLNAIEGTYCAVHFELFN